MEYKPNSDFQAMAAELQAASVRMQSLSANFSNQVNGVTNSAETKEAIQSISGRLFKLEQHVLNFDDKLGKIEQHLAQANAREEAASKRQLAKEKNAAIKASNSAIYPNRDVRNITAPLYCLATNEPIPGFPRVLNEIYLMNVQQLNDIFTALDLDPSGTLDDWRQRLMAETGLPFQD